MRCLTLMVSFVAALSARAQEWPRFRGPNGAGHAVGDADLPVEFGVSKHVVWKATLDAGGHSSPVIVGRHVFLTGATENALHTICLDRATGAERWRRSLEVEDFEKVHRVNSAASPTPAVDGERVFAYFGSFGVIGYDFAGEEVWRRELPRQRNTFGTGASPIVVGDRVILCRDTNDESWVEAMACATGETVWKTDRTGFPSGWSTPIVWRRGDVEELLIYGAFKLTAYDLATGEERWSVPGLADEPCITPVKGDGMVFVTSYNMRTNPEVIGVPQFSKLLEDHDADGSGTLSREEAKANKSILSRFDADGEGDHPLSLFFRFLDRDRDGQLTGEEWQKMFSWLETFKHANALLAIRPPKDDTGQPEIVWQHPRGVPECPSPLYHDGRVYLVKNGGIATCVDAKTGKALFSGRLGARGPRYASPVYGDGKIFAASARGVVTVLEAGDELKVLAQNDLGERVMATPAIVGGRIYVRTEEHLWVFGRE